MAKGLIAALSLGAALVTGCAAGPTPEKDRTHVVAGSRKAVAELDASTAPLVAKAPKCTEVGPPPLPSDFKIDAAITRLPDKVGVRVKVYKVTDLHSAKKDAEEAIQKKLSEAVALAIYGCLPASGVRTVPIHGLKIDGNTTGVNSDTGFEVVSSIQIGELPLQSRRLLIELGLPLGLPI